MDNTLYLAKRLVLLEETVISLVAIIGEHMAHNMAREKLAEDLLAWQHSVEKLNEEQDEDSTTV